MALPTKEGVATPSNSDTGGTQPPEVTPYIDNLLSRMAFLVGFECLWNPTGAKAPKRSKDPGQSRNAIAKKIGEELGIAHMSDSGSQTSPTGKAIVAILKLAGSSATHKADCVDNDKAFAFWETKAMSNIEIAVNKDAFCTEIWCTSEELAKVLNINPVKGLSQALPGNYNPKTDCMWTPLDDETHRQSVHLIKGKHNLDTGETKGKNDTFPFWHKSQDNVIAALLRDSSGVLRTRKELNRADRLTETERELLDMPCMSTLAQNFQRIGQSFDASIHTVNAYLSGADLFKSVKKSEAATNTGAKWLTKSSRKEQENAQGRAILLSNRRFSSKRHQLAGSNINVTIEGEE